MAKFYEHTPDEPIFEPYTDIEGNTHIDEPITTSDVRVIKWLYGVTVDADFTEEPFISSKWKIN